MLVVIRRCSVLMQPSIIENALAMHVLRIKTLLYPDVHVLSYTLEYHPKPGLRLSQHKDGPRNLLEKTIFACRVVKSFAKMRNGYRL